MYEDKMATIITVNKQLMSRCVTYDMLLVWLVIINLTNVVLNCVPYHSRFPTYQTKLSLL